MLDYIKLIHGAGNVNSRSKINPNRPFSTFNMILRNEAKIVEINEINSVQARKEISRQIQTSQVYQIGF